MQKHKKDNQFVKQAYYEGGNPAFRQFVAKNMQYPKEAVDNNIEGVVHLKIDINHLGKVTGAKVMKGIGYGCDEEAIRIIKLAKYEVPKAPRKMRVLFHKNIRIQFKAKALKIEPKIIPKKEIEQEENTEGPPKMIINYSISGKGEQKSNGYSYSVKID